MEYAMVDATIVKVHCHGQGAKGGGQGQAVGRSKGGKTTKIPALTDVLGSFVRFRLMPGDRFDTVGVADLNECGAKVVLSQHPRRAKPIRSMPKCTNGAA